MSITSDRQKLNRQGRQCPERKPQINGFRGGTSGGQGFFRAPELRDRLTAWWADINERWAKGERPYLARDESAAWPMTQHQDSPPVAGKCPRCGDSCQLRDPPEFFYEGLVEHLESCDVCDITKVDGFCDVALSLQTPENGIPQYYCSCGCTFWI